MRFIQRDFWGHLASLVPFLFPWPVRRPFLLASAASRTRDLEWTAAGFLMAKPSLINLRTFCRELALPISLITWGSSHTLFLPHLSTEAANLFCSTSELILVRSVKNYRSPIFY